MYGVLGLEAEQPRGIGRATHAPARVGARGLAPRLLAAFGDAAVVEEPLRLASRVRGDVVKQRLVLGPLLLGSLAIDLPDRFHDDKASTRNSGRTRIHSEERREIRGAAPVSLRTPNRCPGVGLQAAPPPE